MAESWAAYEEAAAELYGVARGEVAQADVRLSAEMATDERLGQELAASLALEDDLSRRLGAGDEEVRDLAAAQLAGAAAVDLALASDLLDLAAAEERGAAALDAGEPGSFGEATARVRGLLELDAVPGASGEVEERAALEEMTPDALKERVSAALDQIKKDAGEAGQEGVSGLIGLRGDSDKLLAALSQRADRILGQVASKARRWIRWAVRKLSSGVSKLLRILPDPIEKWVRKRLKDLIGELEDGTLLGKLLDLLWDVTRIKAETGKTIDAAAGLPSHRLDAVAGQVDALAKRFTWHRRAIEAIGWVLGKLRGKIIALGWWGPAALGAVYALFVGYAIVVGGDHVDWFRVEDDSGLDLVVGVRRTVATGLAGS
jgi:hypothetical protein